MRTCCWALANHIAHLCPRSCWRFIVKGLVLVSQTCCMNSHTAALLFAVVWACWLWSHASNTWCLPLHCCRIEYDAKRFGIVCSCQWHYACAWFAANSVWAFANVGGDRNSQEQARHTQAALQEVLGTYLRREQGLMKSFLQLRVESLRAVDDDSLDHLVKHLESRELAQGFEIEVVHINLGYTISMPYMSYM